MARITGVIDAKLAKITSYGTDGAPVYDKDNVYTLKQFISFTGTKNTTSTQWYSNDTVEETFASIVDYDLELVLGDIDPELEAEINGSDYDTTTKVLTEKSNDVQPEFGLILCLSKSPKGRVFKKYPRCTFTVSTEEAETKTDSISDKTRTLTGKAIPCADGTTCQTKVTDTNVNTDDFYTFS